MTTLISFLGRGTWVDSTRGYRSIAYRFADGATTQQTPYFGVALAEHLQADRLIIAGTSGSMWDVLLADQSDEDGKLFDAVVDADLVAAVAGDKVTASMLAQLEPLVATRLGRAATLALIPYCRTDAEQICVLTSVAALTCPGETIVLDVTHGFRHLPMLALVAARYLSHVRGAAVTDIYYGALDMARDGVAPVISLAGLMSMLDWVEALATYEKDGDYGSFAPLLAKDGMDAAAAAALSRAAFHERTTATEKARERLTSALDSVARHTGAAGALFRDELERRISWFRRPTRHERELALGRAYLARGDYLRAAVFLLEGVVTRLLYDRKLNPSDFTERKDALEELRSRGEDVKLLADVRNAMAHGLRSSDVRINKLLSDEAALAAMLQRLADAFTRDSHS
ncbi:MAG: TIGR02221 family CRISPR-associated protein [Burkholderiales bacterium]